MLLSGHMNDSLFISIIGGVSGAVATFLLGALVWLIALGKKLQVIEDLSVAQSEHSTKIAEFDREIAAYKEFKTSTQKFIDKQLYKDHSPLGLTTFGQKLVKDSGFVDIFEEEKDNLVKLLEAKEPTTQYDVQEMARSMMDELLEYETFQPIKTYAFQNGKDFGQILRAGAIPLRDYYLEKHPEITK